MIVPQPLARRGWLGVAGAGVLAGAAPSSARDAPAEPFRYMLNMSTIRGQNLTPPEQVEIAAKAGYQAVEPWIPDLERWLKSGGNFKDLGKRIADRGLTCESTIGFAPWIVNDDERSEEHTSELQSPYD